MLLFVFKGQGDNLLAKFFQLLGFFCQLIEEGKRLLLSVDGVDYLDGLVVVISYTSELAVKGG